MRHTGHITLLFAVFAVIAPMRSLATDVFVVDIDGEIGAATVPYVQRVLGTAAESESGVVVLRLNTPGGRIDAAVELADAIHASAVPVIAYIDSRAISAGALLAISSDKIASVAGGTIGAATPLYSSGEPASGKIVSFWNAQMRAAAERTGRDASIAEAMVIDDAPTVDSLFANPSDQPLTLSAAQASSVGYTDVQAESIEEALAALGYRDVVLRQTGPLWSESLLGVLSLPFASAVLIILGLGGIFYTIKSGHLGLFSAVGVGAITLFFGVQYEADLATLVEVLLFLLGVGLIIAEVFVIPGFGVAGVSGAALVVASLFLALTGDVELLSFDSIRVPLFTLAASFAGVLILISLMIRYLPSSRAFNRLVLGTSMATSVLPAGATYAGLVGLTGQSLTTLRPAGVAQIGDERYDVVTTGGYIQAGEPVVVVRVDGLRIIVERTVHDVSPQ